MKQAELRMVLGVFFILHNKISPGRQVSEKRKACDFAILL